LAPSALKVTLTTAALPGAIDPIDGTTSYYPIVN
jgi:hypothetical protein